MPARTSTTLHSPSPPTVIVTSTLSVNISHVDISHVDISHVDIMVPESEHIVLILRETHNCFIKPNIVPPSLVEMLSGPDALVDGKAILKLKIPWNFLLTVCNILIYKVKHIHNPNTYCTFFEEPIKV